jgi:Rieske Fe-S protein
MERRSFITHIGQTAAFVCGGVLLNACSKSPSAPSTKLPFSLNLNTDLQTIGSSVINGNVIVVRVGADDVSESFDALSLVCTHQGCAINYQETNQVLFCPCHGSEFDLNGNVLHGPAVIPLAKYTVSISDNTLTVS